jgi:peptidoglycan/xylan/chitin deacetylase (PgdA/CDA1 family)
MLYQLCQLIPAQRLTILIYHQVLAEPDSLYPEQMHARRFAQHMSLLRRYFHPLPLTDAVKRLQQGCLPKTAVAVTFDDGYLNNLEIALPILKQYQIPATCFIATGFSDGSCMWNDIVSNTVRNCDLATLNLHAFNDVLISPLPSSDRTALAQSLLQAIKYLPPDVRLQRAKQFATDNHYQPKPLMMQPADWHKWQAAGMEIGAHTVHHPILASLDSEHAWAEINESREQLLNSGIRLTGFAYPNGRFGKDFNERDVELVKRAGFEFAVSTNPGSNNQQQDCFRLKRFTPWDRSMLRFHIRLLQQHLLGNLT